MGKGFVESQDEIVVCPVLDGNDALFEIYEVYGIPLSELNVHSYMTANPTLDGMLYRGLPVYPMSATNIQRHAGKVHLVLEPGLEGKLVKRLIDNGVSEKNILSLHPVFSDDSPELQASIIQSVAV